MKIDIPTLDKYREGQNTLKSKKMFHVCSVITGLFTLVTFLNALYFLENIQHKTPEHFMVFISSFMLSLSMCLFAWLLTTSIVDFRVKKLERKIVENHIKKDELEREIERNKK